MKIKSLIALFGTFVLLTSCTIKTTENNKRTVSVTGNGTVEVEADNATVILSVITRAKEVEAAATDNALKMTKVQDAIIELGLSKENITTERFSVFQENEYRNGKNIPGDYCVTNRIKIFIKDLSMVSSVIDVALKNGANELSSCSYGISNKDAFVKQARTLAILNAQEAANLLAGTSSATLGKVLHITEHTNNMTGKLVAMKAAMVNDSFESANVSTPVSAGKSTISITVDAVYELK